MESRGQCSGLLLNQHESWDTAQWRGLCYGQSRSGLLTGWHRRFCRDSRHAHCRPVSLTLEAWVTFYAISGIRAVFNKPVSTGTSDSYGLWLQNGTLRGAVGDAPGMGPVLSITFSPIPGRWYHLAYTFDDSTKQQALYVDGVQISCRSRVQIRRLR